MDNKQVLKALKSMVVLMELHDYNPFKIKGYQKAIATLEGHKAPLAQLSSTELGKLPGIGKSIATSIEEIIQSGRSESMTELVSKTPEGLMELLDVKGLGIKKVRSIWQELGLEDLEAFLEAAEKDQLSALKGFGAKTQANVRDILLFVKSNRGKLHFSTAERIADDILHQFNTAFSGIQASPTGELRRKMEIIAMLELVIATDDTQKARLFLESITSIDYLAKSSGPFSFRGLWTPTKTDLYIHFCSPEDYARTLMLTTGSPRHIATDFGDGRTLRSLLQQRVISDEKEAYTALGLPYVEPELREGSFEIDLAKSGKLPELIDMEDLKGALHNHSTYSDGKHSLEEMALHCRSLGYEYLGITDHSQSAFYANGLTVDRIKAQQEEIDVLNEKLAPFKIFKGIESDILSNGALDYEDEILASFDFIVSSIHSGLNMDSEKATERLLKAIANPYTTMLGHATGRLLLKREGYPIDHQRVIDACAEYGVIIEVNANPWRLDLDWRWVHYALSKGVLLSINPDAHEKEGYNFMYYGLCVARKGGLTKDMNFNSLGLKEVQAHFEKRKTMALSPVSK